ncbi:MAG: hypothetical protein A2275_07280 [Bacteroidetes bacterium RIFOXYA12_FULL_35_11]|nr:MAG: hypothetical protein A2275_07280 [Bacteroidetes bacterium RIFOXYA12_FULL_35_11]HBX53786.1 hypothetical protein [Bacteroidales bacterium]
MENEKDNSKLTICPNCGSDKLIKKGRRINKNKEVHLFLCKECNKRFSSEKFKNKTYDISTIVKTLSLYNSGLTIDVVAEKKEIPRSTISNWQSEYRELFNLIRYAKEIQVFRKENRVIEKYKYIHHLVYLYQQHSFKIEKFIKDKEIGLYDYLQKIKNGDINSRVFIESDVRASKMKLNIAHALKITKANNNACKFAMIALELVNGNRERHDAVEKIMLENDTSTIATEVPVFLQLTKSTIPWLRNIKSANNYITGHIDILQYRNGKLYILDYKPGADKEKPLGQLFVYACCLSKATGIPFTNIKLAWFDENVYYETGAMDVYKEVMKSLKKDSNLETQKDTNSGQIKAPDLGFKKGSNLGFRKDTDLGRAKRPEFGRN